MLLLSKLSNGKVVLMLEKCGRCNNYKEMMEHGVSGIGLTREGLLYDIINNSELYLNLEHFAVMCPRHKKQEQGSTFDLMTEDELQLMRETKLADVWMAVEI